MTVFKRVPEERYDEMLGVLPPALHLGKGFLVGEPWTHRKCIMSGQDNTPAFMAFIRRNGEFFEADRPMTGAEFRALEPRHITTTMEPAEAWEYAATWGSLVTNGDPGACMYGFSEDFTMQSEDHRKQCLDWIDTHCLPEVTLNADWFNKHFKGAAHELKQLKRFRATVIAAPCK